MTVESGIIDGKIWEIKRTFGHYTLYFDDCFWCTGDSINELLEELDFLYL